MAAEVGLGLTRLMDALVRAVSMVRLSMDKWTVKKRLLFGIIVLVCLVMTIPLYKTVLTNSSYTLQEGNGEGGPGMSTAAVRKLEQVTLSALPNSVRESPNIVVYIEMFSELNEFYGNSFTEIEEKSPKKCLLPNNSLCIYQHADKKADVVFRFVFFYASNQDNFPFIYYKGQIVAMMNSEAEQEALIEPLKKADIRIDHHIASEITVTEACAIPWREGMYETPDPSKRKGVAMFISNCNAKWRTDYILELAKHIRIDSYGKCWHNVPQSPDPEHRMTTGFDPAKKYRMLVTFENTINHDYITEKISTAYKAGVIPVYWGPPEIYLWAPGNHTFIDPQKFKGPKELAEYLRRVDEDDDLFRHHTTNFNYSIARKTHMENCHPEPYWCQICTLAHKMKMNRGK